MVQPHRAFGGRASGTGWGPSVWVPLSVFSLLHEFASIHCLTLFNNLLYLISSRPITQLQIADRMLRYLTEPETT